MKRKAHREQIRVSIIKAGERKRRRNLSFHVARGQKILVYNSFVTALKFLACAAHYKVLCRQHEGMQMRFFPYKRPAGTQELRVRERETQKR
jgi:hypothetical protein